MENGQHTKTVSASAKPEDISDALTKSAPSGTMPLGELKNSSPAATSAATQNGTTKTLMSAELEELQSKAGLVAGALADFQAAHGIVVSKEISYRAPSGRVYTAIKLYLIVPDAKILKRDSADGLDFYLVAGDSK